MATSSWFQIRVILEDNRCDNRVPNVKYKLVPFGNHKIIQHADDNHNGSEEGHETAQTL